MNKFWLYFNGRSGRYQGVGIYGWGVLEIFRFHLQDTISFSQRKQKFTKEKQTKNTTCTSKDICKCTSPSRLYSKHSKKNS